MKIDEIIDKIKSERIIKGISQIELSESLGISDRTVRRFEKGDLYDTGVRKVFSMLNILSLDFVIKNEFNDRSEHVFNIFDIGQMIKKSREIIIMTQSDLAIETELSRTTINMIENGSVSDIGLNKLINIIDTVGLSLTVTEKESIKSLNTITLENESKYALPKR